MWIQYFTDLLILGVNLYFFPRNKDRQEENNLHFPNYLVYHGIHALNLNLAFRGVGCVFPSFCFYKKGL